MGVSFQRSHDITIETPPSAVYDYVCNPNSWPEWLVASHHIDGEDRPLLRGETFREQWHIKRGEIRLAWTVTESDPPNAWTVEADTDFIGKIVVRYTFDATTGGTKYTRTLRNPDRPSEPSAEQIARMDEEAMIGLQNIKRNVEKRFAKAGQAKPMTEDRRLVVRIDAEKCQGHARCHALAPELFELDEFGSARVRGSGHVSSALEDRAWIARANCPELAIEIVEKTQVAG